MQGYHVYDPLGTVVQTTSFAVDLCGMSHRDTMSTMDSLCDDPQRQQWSSQSCSKPSPDPGSTAGECTAPQPLQTCT